MEDDDLRDEYVLNDTGKLYVGNNMQLFGRPWNFGQVNRLNLNTTGVEVKVDNIWFI